ncbi:BNR-4 repeat-containing protein [Acinetobacter pittii]|uniref:BNR-4 repeat-containing protein n=1 Tax=Acinetobacter pittii TaxID=48296 RepID=UPI001F306FB7|nr:BNR-4 repeat-containing protein [Acinetobacter pittii]
MATNWNAILANINNASDILAILRKVLGLLDGKVDLTRIDEIIADIVSMQMSVDDALTSVNSALSEFDKEAQQAIQQVISAGLMEGFTTEAELLASRPSELKKYAKAEDTDVIWFWNKPEGSPEGNYWTSTGLSELERAKTYVDNKADSIHGFVSTEAFTQGVGLPADISDKVETINGLVYGNDGSVISTTDVLWNAYFIPVEAGDIVSVRGFYGDVGTNIQGLLLQMTANKGFISSLFALPSTGSVIEYEATVTATHDGLIYMRHRSENNTLSHSIIKTPRLNQYTLKSDVTSILFNNELDITSKYLPRGNFVINPDLTISKNNNWLAFFIPVKAGDVIKLTGKIGNSSTTDPLKHLAQYDESEKFIAWIGESEQRTIYTGSVSAKAIQDGLMYVRVRHDSGANDYKIERIPFNQSLLNTDTPRFLTPDSISKLVENHINLTNSDEYETGYVIEMGGNKVPTLNTTWRNYFIPCNKGDQFIYQGRVGDSSVNNQFMVIAQCDEAKAYVEPLGIFTTNGSNQTIARVVGTATQSGFIYIRARLDDDNVQRYNIEKIAKNFADNAEVSALKTQVISLKQNVESVTGSINDTVQQKVNEALDSNIDQKITDIATEKVTEIAASTIESNVAEAIANSEVSSITFIDSEIEKLPIKSSSDHGYNFAPFTQNNVVSFGDYQYVILVDENRNPIVLQRYKLGNWSSYNLANVANNPLAAPNVEDGHNNFSIGITKNGYILIAGNHHNNTCRCVISQNPNDIQSWSKISFSSYTAITYPRFLRYPDGTTQAFWREGSSGDGSYFTATFDDVNKVFNAKTKLIDQASSVVSSPYEQSIGVADDGSLHLCWGYRAQSSSANTNFGMFYAKSTDKGLTWTSASGANSYALPLNDVNSERIYTANQGSGYVNQNGGCCDLNSRYHTVITQYDSNDKTQLCHIWFDGSIWKSELVSDFTFKYDLSGPVTTNELSRPLICVSQTGKIFIVYRTSNMGRANHIRCIDVTTPNSPRDFCLAKFNMKKLEIALNTEYAIKNNEVVMLLSRGGDGVTNELWKNQSTYLLTAPLPI